jgi:hypothetical protein
MELTEAHVRQGAAVKLPDLLRFDGGEVVASIPAWRDRRRQVFDHLVPLAYGGLPDNSPRAMGQVLHETVVGVFGGSRLLSMRVIAGQGRDFSMRVFIPADDCHGGVVLHGDACWHYATDAVIAEVLRRGYVFAQFNRVEVAADPVPGLAEPTFNGPGAIAWWAWAYQRAVDVVLGLHGVDPQGISVIGHSRGGKAALLAGATDARIALTCANNSGAGGAGCFRGGFAGAERLTDLLDRFPHWLNPALRSYVGHEDQLPFDQHFLKALVAPRFLLTTEALGDAWANPVGTWQTHLAAQKVYDLLRSQDQLAICFRPGGHGHTYQDWCTFLDFADSCFRGLPARRPGTIVHTRSPGSAGP